MVVMQGEDETRGVGALGEGTPQSVSLLAASTAKADAYLDEAIRVLRLKARQIEDSERFEHFAHFSAVMKALFEGAIAVLVLSLICAAGVMVWTAAHDNGLLIKPFTVPEDMAARGLSGQVIAARVLDQLSRMQSETQSNRAASSYADDWGHDVRVQIPETGVSVGQLYAYLSRWLGHQTRISGDVFYVAPDQIGVTARVGAGESQTFTGPATALTVLLQDAARSVYAATQPYRYAVYLFNTGHLHKAEAAYRTLISSGSAIDQAWAEVGLENIYEERGQTGRALKALHAALAIKPGFVIAYANLAAVEGQLQHDGAALRYQREYVRLLKRATADDLSPLAQKIDLVDAEELLASERGDYRAEVADDHLLETLPSLSGSHEKARRNLVLAYAQLHDPAAVDAAIKAFPPTSNAQRIFVRGVVATLADLLLGRDGAALASRGRLDAGLKALGPAGQRVLARQFAPFMAYAMARQGQAAAALKLIASIPLDCVDCLRMRGRIDAVLGNPKGADYWFARAVKAAPQVPFAWTDWGAARLRAGDIVGAIAALRQAHQLAPHFADPLELW
ncbi:MAG: hypothetical protein KGO02_05640 [Alphaproteobacteria bacterium]|nr:hypothetical protein [Alphaproteobacteria bacterium]